MMAAGSSRAAARLLAEHGDPETRDDWVPALASGQRTATICISEPGAGSDVGRIRTRVVLFTGAASGLGEATAPRLAGQGAKVLVLDRDANAAGRIAAEIGVLRQGAGVTTRPASRRPSAIRQRPKRRRQVRQNRRRRRILPRDGAPDLETFSRTINVNLIGTYTVKRFHYDSHDQLRTHLADFMVAYHFARRLKTLGGLTPYEYICKIWTSAPDSFILNPFHQMPGLNTW